MSDFTVYYGQSGRIIKVQAFHSAKKEENHVTELQKITQKIYKARKKEKI